MAQTEITVEVKAEKVLVGAEQYLRADWPHGGSFGRPTPNTIQVSLWEESGDVFGFPTTTFGWIANLGMTLITFGLWILPWAAWMVLRMITYKSTTHTAALSAYEKDDGTTHVIIDTNNDEWHKDLEDWLGANFEGSAPKPIVFGAS